MKYKDKITPASAAQWCGNGGRQNIYLKVVDGVEFYLFENSNIYLNTFNWASTICQMQFQQLGRKHRMNCFLCCFRAYVPCVDKVETGNNKYSKNVFITLREHMGTVFVESGPQKRFLFKFGMDKLINHCKFRESNLIWFDV